MKNDNIFQMDKSINVEEIMRQIRENIAKNNQKAIELPDFDSLLFTNDETNEICNHFELKENIRVSNLACHIQNEGVITSHRKVIGPLLILGKKFVRKFLRWYFVPPWNQQNYFNESVVRSLNEIDKLIDGTSRNQNIVFNNLENLIKEKEKTINSLTKQVRQLEKKVDDLSERINNFSKVSNNVHKKEFDEQKIKNCLDNQVFLSEKVRRIERSVKSEKKIGIQSLYHNNNRDKKAIYEYIDFDYFMFEHLYRGSREDIKQRQEVYLKYFIGKTNILDIGCGRGEFLELLRELGVTAKGIDINEDMVRYCLNNGLNVELANVFDYIPKLEDVSLEGIFISQVIEHLYPGDMIKLIQICYDKLVPGGTIVIETVNPTCLLVFAESLYMDLSHIRPVHPLTLDFVLKSNGFNELETLYLSPADRLPYVDSSTMNQIIDRLNATIFGYRDYAIAGKKR